MENDMDTSGSSVGDINTPPIEHNISASEPIRSENHQWDEYGTKVIDSYRQYFYNGLLFIDELYINGPDLVSLAFPKKPSYDLELLLGSKKKKLALQGKDLHEFLVQNLVSKSNPHYFSVIQKPAEVSSITLANLDEVTKYLKTGYHALTKQNAASLACHLDYGEWLNIAYDIHEVQKLGGQIHIAWKDWLAYNVGISDRYARDLREMAKLLEHYPKFRQLGLPFTDLLKHKTQIRLLLRTNQESANFWKQN